MYAKSTGDIMLNNFVLWVNSVAHEKGLSDTENPSYD